MANKTELFIQKIQLEDKLQFQDTYLGASYLGTQLGLEFNYNIDGILSVGQIITIDKTNKSINAWVDGTASIIAITSSSIYPAPSSLVFTDRPLQLPIVFSSNENGFLFFDEVETTKWYEVDLSDTVTFPITFNIADVREINNRNGAYSKTLAIPGTKNNTEVFENIFDIQAIDSYNTRVKVKCSVVVDTVPVLEGYIQLDKIKCEDNNHWTYECVIFGENANFSKEIDQNAKLTDLDFSEFDHNKTIDAITQSWSGDYTDGYYYPLIDYNNGKNPIDILSTPLEGSVLNENFKPAIYVKQYWDKIFKLYGYTYESNFLNSSDFENLIIPTNVKNVKNQDLWRFNSSFKAGITDVIIATFSPMVLTGPFLFGPTVLSQAQDDSITYNWTMSSTGGTFYDDQGIFVDIPGGSFRYENTYEGSVPKNQKIVLQLDYKVTLTGGSSPTPYLGVGWVLYYRFYKNGGFVGAQNQGKVQSFGNIPNPIPSAVGQAAAEINQVQSVFGSQMDGTDATQFERRQAQIIWDTAVNGPINNGDTIEVRLGFIRFWTAEVNSLAPGLTNITSTSYQIEFYPTTNGYDGCYFYNNIDTNLLPGQPYSLSQTIPGNVKQIDFINSIIKMFNLYLSQDKVDPKKIIIEPRNDFYYTNQIIDWSEKLDVSKDISQEPIVDRKKRVLMSYKEDKDLLNSDYKSNTNEIYGQYEYITDNEFETSEQKIDVIFSSTPLSNRLNSDNNLDTRLIYTQILDPKRVINTENYNIIDSNIRILYRKKVPLNGFTFKIYDNNSYLQYNFYPYSGHLDDPTNPELDLSFQEPLFLYYTNFYGYTNNNIYEVYYKLFFEELYGEESKTITAYFYLTPQDLLDFDYRKLIYVDNISSGSTGYFRVNKIEYDPFNKQSYKVELIKVLNNVDFQKTRTTNKPDIKYDSVTKPSTFTGIVSSGNTNVGINNVISGFDNSVRSDFNIVSGIGNQVLLGSSNLITGYRNTTIGDNTGIINSGRTNILGTGRYSNVIGGFSQSLSGRYSNIIGGCENQILLNSTNNQIIGGYSNRIGYNPTGTTSVSQTINSFILGGFCNNIEVGPTNSVTQNTFILGGQNNTVAAGVTNSFILNGSGVTLTQSNTVYIDGTLIVNGTPITGGGSQGPTGPAGPTGSVGPTGPGGDALFEENVIGNRHYIQLISATPSTEEYFLGFSTKPFSGLIISTASTSPYLQAFILNADNSKILSSNGNNIDVVGFSNQIQADKSSFISSGSSCILGTSSYSSIISSNNSSIYKSIRSTIIGSDASRIYTGGNYSMILNSNNSCISFDRNVIINSSTSCASAGYRNTIISSGGSEVYGYYSSIIGGGNNRVVAGSFNSVVIGGSKNYIAINPATNTVIIGGCNNYTDGNVIDSVIIGGCYNCLGSTCRSAIIGGYKLCLSASDTVMVQDLCICGNLFGGLNGVTATFSSGGTTFSFFNGILTSYTQ